MESEGDITNDSNDTPAVIPLYHQKDQQRSHHTFHLSFKVIPNRIFVGGFGSTVKDSDLREVFSQHGTVKNVKIVTGRSGISMGYGFVTFEHQEDVQKILQDGDDISFKDKKLTVGQAFRKHLSRTSCDSGFAVLLPACCGALQQNSLSCAPYISQGGRPHIYCPRMTYSPYQWPSCYHILHHQISPSQVLPQCYQPQYQTLDYPPYQMQFDPAFYSEPSEHYYLPAYEGPPQPVHPMEDTAEEFVEPSVATGSSTVMSEH